MIVFLLAQARVSTLLSDFNSPCARLRFQEAEPGAEGYMTVRASADIDCGLRQCGSV
jgi:hypothetical protein